MLCFNNIAFCTRILNHVTPRMVSAVVASTYRTTHMSRSTSMRTCYAPWHIRGSVFQASFPITATNFTASCVFWKKKIIIKEGTNTTVFRGLKWYLCIFLYMPAESLCLSCRHPRADDIYLSTLSHLHRTPVGALESIDTFLYILHSEDSNFDPAGSVCPQHKSLYHRNLKKKDNISNYHCSSFDSNSAYLVFRG